MLEGFQAIFSETDRRDCPKGSPLQVSSHSGHGLGLPPKRMKLNWPTFHQPEQNMRCKWL